MASTSITGPEANQHTFDKATYNQLTGLDARLLELIDYECRKTRKHSPSGASYCLKPQEWLATCLGVCRETISRHVSKLAALGILQVTHRRPVRGEYQTNLYKIRSYLWWGLGKVLRGLRSRRKNPDELKAKTENAVKSNPHSKQSVSQQSHIATVERKVTSDRAGIPTKIGQTLASILAGWEKRGIGSAD